MLRQLGNPEKVTISWSRCWDFLEELGYYEKISALCMEKSKWDLLGDEVSFASCSS